MGRSKEESRRELPRWLIVGGSIGIGVHFFALAALVLAAPSGPWTTEMGGQQYFMAPQFAQSMNNLTSDSYLRPLRMTHNYHFLSNQLGHPTIELEVKLKDKNGKVFKELRLPNENASLPIRRRQESLVFWLAPDEPQMPPESEKAPGIGGEAAMREHWAPAPGSNPMNPSPLLMLTKTPEHLVPRNGPTFKPSDLAKLLIKSYARHLCRKYGAESAEIIRHTWMPVAPGVLMNDMPAEAFGNRIVHANFGEVRSE